MALVKSYSELKNEFNEIFDILRSDSSINGSNDYVLGLYVLCLKNTGKYQNYSSDETTFKSDFKKSVFSVKERDFMVFRDLYLSIEEIIERVSVKTLIQIFKKCDQIPFGTFKGDFPSLFDDLLYQLSKMDHKETNGYIQPNELSKFIIELADLKNGNSVYNPFAGTCSFGIQLNNNISYVGQEISKHVWELGTLRLLAYNKFISSNYNKQDSIFRWNPINRIFDLIVSNPPFLVKFDKEMVGKFGLIKSLEQFIIENGIDYLTENGKLMVVVTNRFLFRSGVEEKLRKYLIEEDLIEMVVSLPANLLLNSGVVLNLLVISKKKEHKNKVKFVNAKSFFDSKSKKVNVLLNDSLLNAIRNNNSDVVKLIDSDEINQNECNLTISRYYNDLIDLNVNEQLVKLCDVATKVDNSNDIHDFVKSIKIENMKDNPLEYFLDIDNIIQTDKPLNNRVISESCLLLAMRWKSLKPTYFEYQGTPICVPPDIAAIKVDSTKIDIGYLVNEIHSKYVLNQIEALRVGDIVPMIKVKDLMEVKIKVPDNFNHGRFADSLREQQAKVQGLKEAFIVNEEAILYRKKEQLGVQSELQNQNNFLRHSIAGNLDNLNGAFSMLRDIIENQVALKVPESLSFTQNSESTLNLEKLLQIIERDITKIVQDTKWNAMGDKNLNNLILEKLDIIHFINDYFLEVQNRPSNNFTITLTIDEKELMDEEGNKIIFYINANQDKLKDLFDNLIKNAVDHAFISNDKEKNLIDIQFMREDEDFILFSVMNNGKRLPEGFTDEMYTRKGSKAGENSGSGYGGWLIDQILKAHGGEIVEIIDEQGNRGIGGVWSTSIEFNFPILSIERNETV